MVRMSILEVNNSVTKSDFTTATCAEKDPSLSRGSADRPVVVAADATGVAAVGPGETVLEDVDAVDAVSVAAHEVKLVLAVREAARLAAEAGHLLWLLHTVALALK